MTGVMGAKRPAITVRSGIWVGRIDPARRAATLDIMEDRSAGLDGDGHRRED